MKLYFMYLLYKSEILFFELRVINSLIEKETQDFYNDVWNVGIFYRTKFSNICITFLIFHVGKANWTNISLKLTIRLSEKVIKK